MHKCTRSSSNGWQHDADPCECNCTYCNELRRMQALPEITQEDIDQLWDLIPTSLTPGPWKATQLKGFGANNYIVTGSPEDQWYSVIAQLEHVGNFDGMQLMAWFRDGVPMLLKKIANLQKEIDDLRDAARDRAWERDERD